MDPNIVPFSEFIESEMRRLGHSNRTIADSARISFRAVADARSGRLEAGLQSGTFTGRKLIGVTQSTQRLLNGLGADTEFWMKRLGLDRTICAGIGTSVPWRSFTSTSLLVRAARVINKPVSKENIQRVFERAIDAQNALGDIFTAQTILSLLMQELEDQVDQ